jgi:calcineurin-like phosphoesterase family protein
MNGAKRLIVGNHDDIKQITKMGVFPKIMLWRMFPEFGLILSHVPMHESSIREAALNVHGHTHEKGSPAGPYRSVCVELTDYKPINIEDLRVI